VVGFVWHKPILTKEGGFLHPLKRSGFRRKEHMKQTIILVDNNHAYLVHQADAERAMNCLEQNGPFRTYRESSGRIHFICRDPYSGEFYTVVTSHIEERLYAIRTAFQRDHDWEKVQRWLLAKGGGFIANPPKPIIFKLRVCISEKPYHVATGFRQGFGEGFFGPNGGQCQPNANASHNFTPNKGETL